MRVFIFQSRVDTGIIAFTLRQDGGNLPLEFSPWEARGHSAMLTGNGVAGIVGGTDVVFCGIQDNGYFLARFGSPQKS
jgi:hypothetical protein